MESDASKNNSTVSPSTGSPSTIRSSFGHETSDAASYAANSPGDEIDLIEFLGFLWRVRVYALVGLSCGLLAGGLIAFGMLPNVYTSRMSVTIEPKSLPAITDPKRVIEGYSSALNSVDLAAGAFESILRASPALAENLKSSGKSLKDLVAQQSIAEKPESTHLRIVQSLSAQDFIIESRFAVNGLGDDGGEILVAAINQVAREYNGRALNLKDETSRNLLDQATKAAAENENANAKKQLDYETEGTRIRTELAKLEYRLLKQSRSAGIETTQFNVLPTPRTILNFPSMDRSEDGIKRNAPEPDSDLNTDRVLRILGALSEDNKISGAEFVQIQSNVVSLQARFAKAQSLYSSVNSANRAMLDKLFESMQRAVVPIDRGTSFLPLLRMNEALGEAPTGTFEKKSGKRVTLALGAGFLGAILGALTGGLRIFIRKNRAKFKQVAEE